MTPDPATSDSAPRDPDAPLPLEESAAVEVDLDCDECGAPLTWDPDHDALACDHCGTRRPVPRGEGLVVERALEEAGDARRGLGLEVRALRCDQCGAQVALGEAATAVRCAFCGSGQVLAEDARRNALRPESVIPLDVAEADVQEAFRKWLRGLWFRPSALRRLKRAHAVGVYLPAWTFDARATSDWSADAGYYYYVTVPHTVVRNGKTVVTTRQERRVRWVPKWGHRDDRYDDLQVLASRGVDAELALDLGEFDTQALVPYRPEYLAGWQAEEYAIDLEQGFELAVARIREEQRQRCSRDVPGDTQRRLAVETRVGDVRWKLCLLPLWSLTYEHGGKPYAVLVHGQSGRVVGRAPWSPWKIVGFVVGVLALAAGLVGLAALFGLLQG